MKTGKGQKTRNAILLAIAAFIWGSTFVAQDVGMDYIGPFTFLATRSVLGCVALVPLILIRKITGKNDRKREKADSQAENGTTEQAGNVSSQFMTTLAGGICAGVALFCGSIFQQIGIMHTTVGKAGFITTLYILGVPLLGVFLKRKIGIKIWCCAALATVGMYFICMQENLTIGKGDTLVLLCAVSFSIHILVIDYFSVKVDSILLSCLQFAVCALIAGAGMLLFEHPHITDLLQAWLPLFYAGVLSSGVAFTLQIVAQKDMNPAVATLLMSLESVFATISGWVVLGQRMSARESAGCVLVLAAVLIAQIRLKDLRKSVIRN